MKKIIMAAMVFVTTLVVLVAPVAHAGNNTNNFYLSGGCNPNGGAPLLGVNMKFTNYDNGKNQVYHVTWTRSGVAYSVKGIYIDGVYKGNGSDLYINISGHGAHTVKITDTLFGDPYSCSVKR